jgi:hypothetical protein
MSERDLAGDAREDAQAHQGDGEDANVGELDEPERTHHVR